MKLNYKCIGDFISLVNNRNDDGNVENLVGLTIEKKFIPSVANTIGTDLTKYKIIKENQFACSLMQVGRDKKVPIACYQGEPAIISPAYIMFEVTSKELLPEYLSLWIARSEFDREASFLAVGGVRGNLEWEDFCRMKLPVPDIDQQRKIVWMYQTIEKRIKLKEDINDNLEKQANMIFTSWFKIFKPFNNSRPISWPEVDIYSIANIIYGAPFSSELFNTEQNGTPIIRIRDLKNQEFVTYTPEIHSRGYLLKKGDITVGMDGEFRPYLWANEGAWLNQRVCVFENKRPFGKNFLLQTIKPLLNEIEKTQNATTVIHIGKKDFDKFRLYLPDDNTLDHFDEITNPIISKIIKNKSEIIELKQLKNIMLPRLFYKEINS